MLASRWFILAVLFVARFALGYQFQSAGSVAPFLVRELGIDYAAVGMLVGVFLLPGVLISIPSGYLSRHFGDRGAVASGMALMVLGGLLPGAFANYDGLLIGRVISGIGGAVIIVAMSKMVVDWFAHKELFLSMAIFIVGWPVGIAAGQATQGALAEFTSWQTVFMSSAVLAALAMVLVILFYQAPPGLVHARDAKRGKLTGAEMTLICVAGMSWMFLNGAYLVALSFGPAYLMELGMPVAKANSAVSLMSWVTIFGLPLGGYLASRYRAPNIVMVLGLLASIVLGAAIPFSPAPVLTFTLFGTALALATPVLASLAAEVLQPRIRASGFGLYYFWYFVGMPVLIPVAGLLRDKTGSVTASLVYAAFLMLCCLVLLGLFRLAQARWGVDQYAGGATAGQLN